MRLNILSLAVFIVLTQLNSKQVFASALGLADSIALINDSVRSGRPDPLKWASFERVTLDGRPPNSVTQLRTIPSVLTAAIYGGAVAGLHIYQANAWWSKDRAPFHITDDWSENLQNDKFGHFYASYLISYLNREALIESGFSDESAHNIGALMGLLYQLYVETEDGYSKYWGFSPTDAYADIAGSLFFLCQYHIPVLQNFHEKWTYFPSKFLGSGSIPGQKRTFIDDYQGQSYWWSVDLWNLLPKGVQSDYPKFLQLAVGYTAKRNTTTGTSDLPDTREFYISLDYSLMHLLPKSNIPIVNWLIQGLDNIHFPAPAVRLTPKIKFFLLYPIQFHLGNLFF
ncbi:MAG TPA: DUF2279 domain-containing protein [Candidatus Kapabacteria bacterium]|nr:DUF2279 domain-containing protein [Candidatus Kapabacteria bacterium]